MEFTAANPFIPGASFVRFPNSIFEARIHLPGAAAHVDVVPYENMILVTGSIAPRIRVDAEGAPSTLVFSDQPCGVFGRDIPVNLTSGTELVVLSAYQDCDDYVVRYTIRNSITPRPNCADLANAAAAGVGGVAAVGSGSKGPCGGAVPPQVQGLGYARSGAYAVPPAALGRGHGGCAGSYGSGGSGGYGGYNGPYVGPGYAHPYGFSHGSGFPHGTTFANPGYTQFTPGLVFHPNGGATF